MFVLGFWFQVVIDIGIEMIFFCWFWYEWIYKGCRDCFDRGQLGRCVQFYTVGRGSEQEWVRCLGVYSFEWVSVRVCVGDCVRRVVGV